MYGIHAVTQQFTQHTSTGSCPHCPTCTHVCKCGIHSQCIYINVINSMCFPPTSHFCRLSLEARWCWDLPLSACSFRFGYHGWWSIGHPRESRGDKIMMEISNPRSHWQKSGLRRKQRGGVVLGIRGSRELLYPALGPRCRLPGHQSPSEQQIRDWSWEPSASYLRITRVGGSLSLPLYLSLSLFQYLSLSLSLSLLLSLSITHLSSCLSYWPHTVGFCFVWF